MTMPNDQKKKSEQIWKKKLIDKDKPTQSSTNIQDMFRMAQLLRSQTPRTTTKPTEPDSKSIHTRPVKSQQEKTGHVHRQVQLSLL